MKKFFVIFVMVIAMTTGLVGQAFAGTIDVENVTEEDVERFETLMDEYEYVFNNYSGTSQMTLVSQRVFMDKCWSNDGAFYDYCWEVEAYDTETNSFVKASIWIGNGEYLDEVISSLHAFDSSK